MSYKKQMLANSIAAIALDASTIQKVLGIESLDSMSEEFWKVQVFAARDRYFRMLLDLDGVLPLHTDRKNLDDLDLQRLTHVSEQWHKANFSYADVRNWWKDCGRFKCDKAFKLRREQMALENTSLGVLFIFEKGAKWLAYDVDQRVSLVQEQELAHVFKVESVSQLEKPYLLEMAKHFDSLKERLGANVVKVLVVKGE